MKINNNIKAPFITTEGIVRNFKNYCQGISHKQSLRLYNNEYRVFMTFIETSISSFNADGCL